MSWSGPSPFIFDGPVAPHQLLGRDAEIAALRGWARAGRFTSLVAPRRFGKTSLIAKLAVEAEAHDEIAVIVADLFDVASMADLVLRLERAWAHHTPLRLRDRVASILAGSKVGLSIAGTGFSIALAERPDLDPLPALHTLLDLPNRIAADGSHARVLVVLDEFQSLGGVAGAEALLRSHAQHQRAVASYLFAGSEPSMIARAFEDRARPFFGQVETFRLGGLPFEELAEGVERGFAQTDRRPGDQVGPLVQASAGHPQRAMLLAHLLWTATSPGATATPDTWTQTLHDALRRIDPEARAVLGGLGTAERKTLRAVAEYADPLSSRARSALDLPKSSAASAARRLEGEGVLERDEHGWRLVDPLLARWIKTEMPTRAL